MNKANLDRLRDAVRAARDAIQHAHLDACDSDDLDEILEPVERELAASNPNSLTLSTYLNSLVRSLRAEPGARGAVAELNDAMRDSGLPPQ
jgi:hypothetical protein